MKNSTLNPLANTFVPSNAKAPSEMVTIGKISTKSMAAKLIKDLVEAKKGNSEKSVTKEEIIAIVEKLISLRHKENPACDTAILKSYLTRKVPNILNLKPLVATKRDIKDPKASGVASKIKSFDLSAFRAPKLSILLVSFWGINRQEQALRPMLSLTLRPEGLEDKIWSVTSKDLKVWNTCAIETPCSCPPMFGYTVPPDFFGNPFNLESKCSIKSIHLNHYPDTENGNELVAMDNERRIVLCSDVFSDMEQTGTLKDLEYYSKQFINIVSGVCKLISDEGEDSEEVSEIEESSDTPLASGVAYDFMKSLWDSDSSESNRPTGDEIVEDDGCHPLLDALQANADEILKENSNYEGVTLEIEEMIRKSLSTETEAKGPNSKMIEHEGGCDPPCSTWCHSSPKSSNRSSEAISILNETTEFLMRGECSGSKRPSNAFEIGLNRSQRPYFKRSFSANDCDSYETYKMGTIAQVSTSTREALAFLRNDPINFFKRLNDRHDSWRDSDSGIVSYSSQEDVFCDEVNEEELLDDCSTPMWNFFSGEGSMWKPLPSSQDETVKFPHKRVRELRRQRSLN